MDAIAHLEAATVGGRELDAMIAEAMGFKTSWAGPSKRILIGWDPLRHPASRRVKRWSTVFEIALTLIPENHGISKIVWQPNPCAVIIPDEESWPFFQGESPTPALAVCIASLKAIFHARDRREIDSG